MASPELQWRGYRAQQRRLDVVGIDKGGPFETNLTRAGLLSPGRGHRQRPADRGYREPFLTMWDEMKARAALLGDPGFRPSLYPGLTEAAQQSGDQGWIAWSILAEVRTVVSFARHEKLSGVEAIQMTVDRVYHLATEFIETRLLALGPYEKAKVERAARNALKGTGDGGRDYPYQDVAEPERERANDLLGIECPWIMPPEPPTLERQIIDQLRARGRTASEILRVLVHEQLDHGVEAADLRREFSRNAAVAPPPSAPPSSPAGVPAQTPAATKTGTRRKMKPWERKVGLAIEVAARQGRLVETGKPPTRDLWKWIREHVYESEGLKIPSYLSFCRGLRAYYQFQGDEEKGTD